MISQLEDTINRKVKESIDENQKEYYLREKLRAIKDELGDTVDKGDDADQIRKELAEIHILNISRIKLKKNYVVLKLCHQHLQKRTL